MLENLVALVRLADIHQGQHHENECLQGNDQDVEDSPDGTRDDMTEETIHRGRTAHECNQHEYQFTSIHVAEQSHAVGNGLRQKFDHLHQEVDRIQKGVRAKRRSKEFVNPATETLDLDVVVHTDQENTD